MLNETLQTLFAQTGQTFGKRGAPDLCWSSIETWPGSEPKTLKVITSVLVPCSTTPTLSSNGASNYEGDVGNTDTPLSSLHSGSKSEGDNRKKIIGVVVGAIATIVIFVYFTVQMWNDHREYGRRLENMELQPMNTGQGDDG